MQSSRTWATLARQRVWECAERKVVQGRTGKDGLSPSLVGLPDAHACPHSHNLNLSRGDLRHTQVQDERLPTVDRHHRTIPSAAR